MNFSRKSQVAGGRNRIHRIVFVALSVHISVIGPGTFGKDAAPPSSERPWSPPQLEKYERELARQSSQERPDAARVAVNPNKVYNLPELIDIAERNNPDTRIAWERARKAAAAVGLNESAYYPYLVASAAAGYERTIIPAPSYDSSKGRIIGDSLAINDKQAQAALSVKWLLLDFGRRDAAVNAARENLMGANVGFNATHQKIVFDVTERFYALNNARQQVIVSKSALVAAETVEQAARARHAQGLATMPEVLQAQQQSAQFAYDVEAATGLASDAQVALVEGIGILPTSNLQVADIAGRPLPETPSRSVEALIDLALSQRPDLVGKLANVRAMQAEVRKARADYYPTVSLSADVGRTRYKVSADDSAYNGDDHTTYGVFLKFEVPIFDGFARRQKLRVAEAELRAAESELEGARDAAVREVWKAYTDFKTALRKQDAAAKLLAAAEKSYAAVLDSYQHGLSTYVEVVNAQRNVTSARSVGHDTRSAIFTRSTALALSIGNLARPKPEAASARKR